MATDSKDLSVPAPEAEPTFKMSDFATVIGNAVAEGIARNTHKRVPYGEYISRGTHSSYHEGKHPTKLKHECWQNGSRIEFDTTTDKEIALLNKITHSGRYINRLVEVIFNIDGSEPVVYISFPCNSVDKRFSIQQHCKGFTDMLEQIVKVQVEEDAEAELKAEEKAARRRHFGDTKAYREAAGKV